MDGYCGDLVMKWEDLTEIYKDGRPWELNKPIELSARILDQARQDYIISLSHIKRWREKHKHYEEKWMQYPNTSSDSNAINLHFHDFSKPPRKFEP